MAGGMFGWGLAGAGVAGMVGYTSDALKGIPNPLCRMVSMILIIFPTLRILMREK